MSTNVEDNAPVRGLLNRKSLLLVAVDTAQDPVPDGNQARPIEMSEVFKQIRELAGLTPYPQDSDTWDILAHPKIFMVLTADTNLITINDDTPGQDCQGEFIQDAAGNHKLTINGEEMAISGKGRSLVKGLRWQDKLRFDQPGPLAGSKPEITEQPIGMTATIGTTAAFQAKAINWDSVSLLKNSAPVPNTEGTAYQVAISFESKGAYQFKFSNRYGFTLTDPANIDSTESDIPAIVSEPTDQTIDEGGSFSLPFIVSGPNLIFRVYKNNTLISTSSANVFTKTAAKTTDSGTYRIEAGNTLGQVVSVTVTVTVNAIILPVPIITFTQPSGMTVGAADQTLSASSSNSLTPIVFTTSDSSVATIISGNKLRVIAPGTVDIIASQVAGNGYQAAVSVTRSVVMSAQPVAVITFAQPADMTIGDPDQSLTYSSTNAVTTVNIVSSNTNVASIVNGKLRILSAGTVTITATQASGNGYQAAQPVSWTVTLKAQAAAVITFNQPSNMTVGDPDQELSASSTNTVTPVTFSTSNTSVATIVSGKLHIVSAGTFNVFADQAAGNGFLAATRVTRSVTSTPGQAPQLGTPQIALNGISSNAIGVFVQAVTNATNYAFFRSLNPDMSNPVQIYSGPNISFNSTGLTPNTAYYFRIDASANGFVSSSSVIATANTLNVSLPTPTITFSQPANMNIGAQDQSLVASSTNTVTPITFTTDNPNVATIVSGKLHIVGEGSVQVIASQAAGNGYNAAPDVVRTVVINSSVPNYDVTVIESDSLASYSGNPDFFVDANHPFTTSKYQYGVMEAISGSGVNPGFYKFGVNAGAGYENASTLPVYDDKGTGVTKINSTPTISNGVYKAYFGKTNGGGLSGSGLISMKLNSAFHDKDSPTNDNILGAVLIIPKAIRNAPSNPQFLVINTYKEDIYANGNPVHIMQLRPFNHSEELSDKIVMGHWSIFRAFPYPDTAPIPSFTGRAVVGLIADSNTEYQGNLPQITLQKILPNASVVNVINRGYAGSSINAWLPSANTLYPSAVTEFNNAGVTVISINLGTNLKVDNIDVPTFLQRFAVLVDQLYVDVPTLKKIIIQEVAFSFPGFENDMKALNTAFANFGHNTVFGVTGIYDFQEQYPEYVRDDKIHFLGAGYRAMANAQQKGIAQTLIANP